MPGGKQQPPCRNDGWDQGGQAWEGGERPACGEAGKAPLAGNATSVLQGALHALPVQADRAQPKDIEKARHADTAVSGHTDAWRSPESYSFLNT